MVEPRIFAHSMQAINVSKGGKLVARRVERAETSAQRRKGLLGRSRMEPEDGLYIVPCEWVHTFGMQFPIDLAFLAADGRVLCVHHCLKPNRLSKIAVRAQGVLELAAGRLRATDTVRGDVIRFQDAPPNEED